MDKPMIDSLSERVERLERENRGLKRIGALALAGAVAILVAGADAGKLIEAERFVLKDKGGRKRAELSSDSDGSASLSLFDRSGKVRLRMAIDGAHDGSPRGAALISVCDNLGRDRIVTQVNEFGAPQLNFSDDEGKDRLDVVLDDVQHFVMLDINDRKDARRFCLVGGEDGGVSMHFEDTGPKARLSLYAGADGKAGVTILDGDEKDRALLEGASNGRATLKFLDEGGQPLFQAPKP
jgi:hypothetical protein